MSDELRPEGPADRDVSWLLTRDAAITEVGTGDDRTIRVVASTEDEDSHGTVLRNWNLERYRSNPTVLFAHDRWALPIGTAEDIKAEPGRLSMAVRFLEKDDNEMADKVLRCVRKKALRATSVGFRRCAGTKVMTEMRGAPGEAPREVTIIDGPELVELSMLPIGSNPNALAEIRALATGHPATEPAKQESEMANDATATAALEATIAERDAKITDLQNREMKLTAALEANRGLVTAHEARVKELQAENAKLVRAAAEDKIRGFIGKKINPAQAEAILKFADQREIFDEKVAALADWPDMPATQTTPVIGDDKREPRSESGAGAKDDDFSRAIKGVR